MTELIRTLEQLSKSPDKEVRRKAKKAIKNGLPPVAMFRIALVQEVCLYNIRNKRIN